MNRDEDILAIEKIRKKVFSKHLLKYCLKKLGTRWYTNRSDTFYTLGKIMEEKDTGDKLFKKTIGKAVLNTLSTFEVNVQEHSSYIWNYMAQKISSAETLEYLDILNRINEVAHEIYCSDIYESEMQCTYVFLAVMVDVARQCASNGEQSIIKKFFDVIPFVLDARMPYDLNTDYDRFLEYAKYIRKPCELRE